MMSQVNTTDDVMVAVQTALDFVQAFNLFISHASHFLQSPII